MWAIISNHCHLAIEFRGEGRIDRGWKETIMLIFGILIDLIRTNPQGIPVAKFADEIIDINQDTTVVWFSWKILNFNLKAVKHTVEIFHSWFIDQILRSQHTKLKCEHYKTIFLKWEKMHQMQNYRLRMRRKGICYKRLNTFLTKELQLLIFAKVSLFCSNVSGRNDCSASYCSIHIWKYNHWICQNSDV